MLHLILLAAGQSKRFGSNKLLFRLKGKPLYEYALDCAVSFQQMSSFPVKLILVTAYDEIESGAFRQGFTAAGDVRHQHAGARAIQVKDSSCGADINLRVSVRNQRQEEGIAHSILLGLSEAKPEKEDILMFNVCDQPYQDSRELLCFFNSFLRSGKGIGCMAFGENRGNPVLFRAEYQGELLSLRGDEGGRKVIQEHGGDLFLYQTASPKRLRDIDSKNDLPDDR